MSDDIDKLWAIQESCKSLNRPMTKEEYRFVKTCVWYYQKKFWQDHLTKEGFNAYTLANSEGSNGKWFVYLRLWDLYNSPLSKALL